MKIEELIQIAMNARKNAMVPITGYKVGAALLTKQGTIYMGANIENKEIPGLSNCAERVAIQNALTHGERAFESIVIIGGKEEATTLEVLAPCGVCLQYMTYFCPDIQVGCEQDGKMEYRSLSCFFKKLYTFKD